MRSFFASKIYPSLFEFPATATPFAGRPFSLFLAPDFRRAFSYLHFHLLPAFLRVLHAPACTTYLPSRLREASTRLLARSLLLPRQSFYSFPRREDGRANSFKSRCGPGNSANPLRIHRAPLANSSLAPNVFLSAHPFTAHRARARARARMIVFGSFASLLFPSLLHPISCSPFGPFSQLSDSCGPFPATGLRISRNVLTAF